MKIEKASNVDLEKMYAITKSCGKQMVENGIFQWNELYPSKEVLQKDIELQQIWKLTNSNSIVGIIVLTEIEDKEYKNVKWLTKNIKDPGLDTHFEKIKQNSLTMPDALKSYNQSGLNQSQINFRKKKIYSLGEYIEIE